MSSRFNFGYPQVKRSSQSYSLLLNFQLASQGYPCDIVRRLLQIIPLFFLEFEILCC